MYWLLLTSFQIRLHSTQLSVVYAAIVCVYSILLNELHLLRLSNMMMMNNTQWNHIRRLLLYEWSQNAFRRTAQVNDDDIAYCVHYIVAHV